MDYMPPPDLKPQYAFVQAAKSHFLWRGVVGDFGPTFTRSDLSNMEDQADASRTACLRQLQATGRCEITGLKARNGDDVVMLLDRSCAILQRSGQISGSTTFPVPAAIGQKLPDPAQPAPPLDCSKPGVIYNKTSEGKSTSWLSYAGQRVAHNSTVLAPAIPGLPRPHLGLSTFN